MMSPSQVLFPKSQLETREKLGERRVEINLNIIVVFHVFTIKIILLLLVLRFALISLAIQTTIY